MTATCLARRQDAVGLLGSILDRKAPDFCALSDAVWEVPELNYEERQSAALHREMLVQECFTVTEALVGIPTAIRGEYGETGPVITFLGEYDALPGLSQVAGIAERRALQPGGNGHGCGHNMLGTASLLAAAVLKDTLAELDLAARVQYIGCPAEEGGSAKSFLVREGVFDDVDTALCWHPSAFTGLIEPSSLACLEAEFRFEGRASHAAVAPQEGRSALDAVELMNVGVNYLREHMPSNARVHYAVTDTGGSAPNVVQPQAAVRYVVRGGTLPEMWVLFDRVRQIATGAALMTETTVSDRQISGEANMLGNTVLEDIMTDVLHAAGGPDFDAADHAFAAEIARTLPEGSVDRSFAERNLPRPDGAYLTDAVAPRRRAVQGFGSTDVGTVSWAVPTVQCAAACYAVGTPGHSWQLVAQGKSGMAHKGLVHAARLMALAALRLVEKPVHLTRAHEEHRRLLGKTPFHNPVTDVKDLPWSSG